MTNEVTNRAAGIVSVVPRTSNVERIFPFEVLLDAAASNALADSRVGVAPPAVMRSLEAALHLGLG